MTESGKVSVGNYKIYCTRTDQSDEYLCRVIVELSFSRRQHRIAHMSLSLTSRDRLDEQSPVD